MKTFEELSFVDDFMFCKVLEDNEDLCKELLELILEKPIRMIKNRNKQKSIDIAYDGKGIRLDVYVEDGDSTVYDIEMQTTPELALPKRSRYYQGMIDLDIIEKGAMYQELKKSYIIFICNKNPFEEKQLHKYSFENVCMEDKNIRLEDETVKVFLTPDGIEDDISPKMKDFLNFISSGTPNDDFTRRLDEAVAKQKVSKERKKEFMKFELLMQEERAKGRAEGHASGLAEGHASGLAEGHASGLAEGVEHGKLSILRGLMQTTNCSVEEALKMGNVPEEEWETYLDLLNKKEQ